MSRGLSRTIEGETAVSATLAKTTATAVPITRIFGRRARAVRPQNEGEEKPNLRTARQNRPAAIALSPHFLRAIAIERPLPEVNTRVLRVSTLLFGTAAKDDSRVVGSWIGSPPEPCASADLSPTLGANGLQRLALVEQPASISLNDWGTEAAAATGVVLVPSAFGEGLSNAT